MQRKRNREVINEVVRKELEEVNDFSEKNFEVGCYRDRDLLFCMSTREGGLKAKIKRSTRRRERLFKGNNFSPVRHAWLSDYHSILGKLSSGVI